MVVQYCDVCNLVLNGCNIQAFVGFQLSEIPFVSLWFMLPLVRLCIQLWTKFADTYHSGLAIAKLYEEFRFISTYPKMHLPVNIKSDQCKVFEDKYQVICPWFQKVKNLMVFHVCINIQVYRHIHLVTAFYGHLTAYLCMYMFVYMHFYFVTVFYLFLLL